MSTVRDLDVAALDPALVAADADAFGEGADLTVRTERDELRAAIDEAAARANATARDAAATHDTDAAHDVAVTDDAGHDAVVTDDAPDDAAVTDDAVAGEAAADDAAASAGAVEGERFEIIDELARGGLGRVVRARDLRTGRVVALKHVLRQTPELIARFEREAMVTANLQHPAIVPVYEVGRWSSGEPYYAMKLVRGRALDTLIAETTSLDGRLALLHDVIAVADALAYAHSEGVIHRDLKPANVLIGPYGETVVIDWGLARHVGDDAHPGGREPSMAGPRPTMVGDVMGTPSYMPPEQAAGQPLDARADVYAIGAMR